MIEELASLSRGQEGEKSLWAVWEHPMWLLLLQGSGLFLSQCKGRVHWPHSWEAAAKLVYKKHTWRAAKIASLCGKHLQNCLQPHPCASLSLPSLPTLTSLSHIPGTASSAGSLFFWSSHIFLGHWKVQEIWKEGTTFKVKREWMMEEGEQTQKSIYTHTTTLPDS